MHLRRSLLALTLAAALSSCGAESPPPAAAPDGGVVDPSITRVAVGPEKSGAAVRLLWVAGADGSRTRLDVPLYASRLSADAGLPVLCTWERVTTAGSTALCVPIWPAAIRESGQTVYATSACSSAERLVFEPMTVRSCAGGRAAFSVAAHADAAMCQTDIAVWDVQKIDTPAQTYGMRDGTCRPLGAGNPALVYYRTGREVTAQIPKGEIVAE